MHLIFCFRYYFNYYCWRLYVNIIGNAVVIVAVFGLTSFVQSTLSPLGTYFQLLFQMLQLFHFLYSNFSYEYTHYYILNFTLCYNYYCLTFQQLLSFLFNINVFVLFYGHGKSLCLAKLKRLAVENYHYIQRLLTLFRQNMTFIQLPFKNYAS